MDHPFVGLHGLSIGLPTRHKNSILVLTPTVAILTDIYNSWRAHRGNAEGSIHRLAGVPTIITC